MKELAASRPARLMDIFVRPVFKLGGLEPILLRLYTILNWKPLLKLAPMYYSYPAQTMRTCSRNGIRYNVDISTLNGWRLFYHKSANESICSLVKAGQTMFDIGAHIGEVSLRGARQVGEAGKVFSFEPNPTIYAQLVSNVNFNADLSSRITCVNSAVGRDRGHVHMVQSDPRNPGTVSVAHIGSSEECICHVPILSIDQYVCEHGIEKIDFIKIDVEGYECDVIIGASRTIAKWRPRLYVEVCDVHQRRQGRSAKELIDLLVSLKYDVMSYPERRRIEVRDLGPDTFLNALCEPDR